MYAVDPYSRTGLSPQSPRRALLGLARLDVSAVTSVHGKPAPEHREEMPDPRVIWLRDQIIERLRTAMAVKTNSGEWRVGQVDEAGIVDVDDAEGKIAAGAVDVGAAAHIAMNDPGTAINTCLAELEILAEHTSIAGPMPSGASSSPCRTCGTAYPCRTVRRLHSAYRKGWAS